MEPEINDSASDHFKWQDDSTISAEDTVSVYVELDPHNEKQLDFIEQAHIVFAELREQETGLRNLVAEEQLELYNDAWNENSNDMTVGEFVSYMKLTQIVISDHKGVSIELSYSVGDLFTDRILVARFNDQFQLWDVEIAG